MDLQIHFFNSIDNLNENPDALKNVILRIWSKMLLISKANNMLASLLPIGVGGYYAYADKKAFGFN